MDYHVMLYLDRARNMPYPKGLSRDRAAKLVDSAPQRSCLNTRHFEPDQVPPLALSRLPEEPPWTLHIPGSNLDMIAVTTIYTIVDAIVSVGGAAAGMLHETSP